MKKRHAQHIWHEWLTLCERPISGIARDANRDAYGSVDEIDIEPMNSDYGPDEIRSAMEFVSCKTCQRSLTLARRLDELEVRSPPQSRVRRRDCEQQDSHRVVTPDKMHSTSRYYMNTNPHLQCDYDIYGIHKAYCRHIPATDRRISLGQFNDCHGAVKEAERRGYQVYACYYCCRDCYKPTF